MNTENLLNLSVAIVVSDPWEFGSECGIGPFTGTVTDTTPEKLVIRLSAPIHYRGKTLKTVVAQTRHAGDELQMIMINALSANLMLLPLDIRLASELQPSLTKDGVVTIGTVECTS